MKKINKVAIVGMGRVGSSAAYNIGVNQTVDVIYAIDNNIELRDAQIEDLQSSFIIEDSKTKIVHNNYENLQDVDIMIITVGAPTSKLTDRLELVKSSSNIIKKVVKQALDNSFNGIFLVATNPVDIMCNIIFKEFNYPAHKIVGTGTILDNARLKNVLSNKLNVDSKNIDSVCIGEHGNSIVPLYSQIEIDNINLNEYLKNNTQDLNKEEITNLVITAGPRIFNSKGATEFGIASSLNKIVSSIINDKNEDLLVTSLTYVDTVGDIFIPLPTNVNKHGATSKVLSNMSQQEYKQFVNSAQKLRDNY